MLNGTHSNPVDIEIGNSDPFYPDLNVREFQEQRRVPASLAPALIAAKLNVAILQINRRLTTWKTRQTDAGRAKLADVPQDRLNVAGSPVDSLLLYYREAVFHYAMAELHPDVVSIMARDEAMDYREKSGADAREHYGLADDFLNRLKGEPVRKAKPGGFFSALI